MARNRKRQSICRLLALVLLLVMTMTAGCEAYESGQPENGASQETREISVAPEDTSTESRQLPEETQEEAPAEEEPPDESVPEEEEIPEESEPEEEESPGEEAPPDRSLPQEDEPEEVTVFITKTGAKYHRDNCRYLSKSKIPISLTEAKRQGYTPCSVCDPPE